MLQIGQRKIILKQANNNNELIIYEEKNKAEEERKKISSIFCLTDKREELKSIYPKPPLITSLLLSEAKFNLKFSVSQTTKLAQKLYEGV